MMQSQQDGLMAITHTPSSGMLAEHIGDNYETPAPAPSSSFAALKDRIKRHYEICSDYYYSLWYVHANLTCVDSRQALEHSLRTRGEHIHHGYFLDPADTKEVAQARLIDLLIERSKLVGECQILDVGCGIGGTSRYLARQMGCSVTGVTISGQQVKLATDLSEKEAGLGQEKKGKSGSIRLGDGSVRFLELDAEKMGDFFNEPATKATFECVWISEAMSHLPDKELFFRNASMLLNPGGKLVVADWFKAEGLTDAQMEADIKPIEGGMLLPGLNTQSEYVKYAEDAGFKVFSEPFDISREVSKTWDISWSLVQNPSLWAFAISQGRDGLAFLQAFRAMRRAYANGTFRYAVMVFQK